MHKPKTYYILKGKHSAKGLHLGFTLKKKIAFECKFGEGCVYGDLGDNDNYDINKLYGFSTTWFNSTQYVEFFNVSFTFVIRISE
jgi:hypothetical protein